jgi:hypothetical protein
MGIRVLLCCFLLQNTDYKNSLLFTPFSATRFAMHRIYANRINSRSLGFSVTFAHKNTSRDITSEQ